MNAVKTSRSMKHAERIRRHVRQLREKSGLSQTDVAKKIEVTQPCVSSWELNSTWLPVINAVKLAKLYGTTVEDIVKA